MQIMDILNSKIENKEIEYKLALDTDKDKIEKWAKTIVGFANSQGGYICVGSNNFGDVVGLTNEEIDKYKVLVLKTIDRYIFPHISVKFEIAEIDLKNILLIYIDQTDEIVIFKSGDYNEKVYIREDGSTLPANVNQILKLGNRKFGIDKHVSNEIYQQKNYTDYLHLAKRYRNDHIEPTLNMMISADIINEDERVKEGLRMFSNSYNSDDSLVVCRLWDGNSKGVDKALDIKEFKGALGNVFSDAINFVLRNSKSGFIKMKDGSRLDTRSYPEQALREAIINAIAHRDYSIQGTQIDIDIFNNRIEIVSPGPWLLSKKTSDYSLDEIPSIRRNKVICNCFVLAGLMEKSGSGFKKINEIYSLAEKKPMIKSTNDYFLITLFDLLVERDNTSNITYGKYDIDILDFCLDYARSRDEIQKHIGYKSVSHFLVDVLKPLINSKMLLQTLPTNSKNQKYITNKEKYLINK